MTRNHRIAVLAGDGIGPEVMREALRVLDAAAANSALPLSVRKNSWAAPPLMPAARRFRKKQLQPVTLLKPFSLAAWRPEVGSSPAQTASGSGGAAAAAQALQALLQPASGTHLPGTRQSFSLARRHLCSRL